jgi:hypothetical protein
VGTDLVLKSQNVTFGFPKSPFLLIFTKFNSKFIGLSLSESLKKMFKFANKGLWNPKKMSNKWNLKLFSIKLLKTHKNLVKIQVNLLKIVPYRGILTIYYLVQFEIALYRGSYQVYRFENSKCRKVKPRFDFHGHFLTKYQGM